MTDSLIALIDDETTHALARSDMACLAVLTRIRSHITQSSEIRYNDPVLAQITADIYGCIAHGEIYFDDQVAFLRKILPYLRPSPEPVAGEISLVEGSPLFEDIAEAIDQCGNLPVKLTDRITEVVLGKIRPYLRTTEPVLVSLEKVGNAIANAYEMTHSNCWTPSTKERMAKAALDAAGVKYHG